MSLSRLFPRIDRKNFILLLSTLFSILLILEIGLRISNKMVTYGEQRLGAYSFVHHGSFSDSFHLHYPGSTFNLGSGEEFLYPRTANEFGLTDINWENENPENKPRVLCLGDSFTEGDGAPADSTWPVLLNNMFHSDSLDVQVLNAGVCGSDPYFELMLFDEKFRYLQPDILIFTISMQDFVEDIAVRGGNERFLPETGKKTKLIEVFYAYCHVARWVLHKRGYNWLLLKYTDDLIQDLATKNVPEVMANFAASQKKNPNTEYFVFLYPHKGALILGTIKEIQSALVKESLKYPNINFIDLYDCYQTQIASTNLPVDAFWWEKDGHHNSLGYSLKASCINEHLGLYIPEIAGSK